MHYDSLSFGSHLQSFLPLQSYYDTSAEIKALLVPPAMAEPSPNTGSEPYSREIPRVTPPWRGFWFNPTVVESAGQVNNGVSGEYFIEIGASGPLSVHLSSSSAFRATAPVTQIDEDTGDLVMWERWTHAPSPTEPIDLVNGLQVLPRLWVPSYDGGRYYFDPIGQRVFGDLPPLTQDGLATTLRRYYAQTAVNPEAPPSSMLLRGRMQMILGSKLIFRYRHTDNNLYQAEFDYDQLYPSQFPAELKRYYYTLAPTFYQYSSAWQTLIFQTDNGATSVVHIPGV